ADGRRYSFENPVIREKMVDLGLRLADVEAMGLQSEPVKIEGDREKRRETLRRHGANWKEIDFLLGDGEESPRRVELNAMTSRKFVDFIERKLTEHGVKKAIPEPGIIEQHARRLIEQQLAAKTFAEIRDWLAAQAEAYELPDDLERSVRQLLA